MDYTSLIMLVVLFALMYFMLIRPQQKKDKEVREMRESLKAGDEIVTIGGLLGKVVRIKDDIVTIEFGADKTRIDVAKWGISGKVSEMKADGTPKKKTAPAAEEKSDKPSPKTIKKLGQKEEPAAELAEAAAKAEEAVAEAVQEAPAEE